MRKKLSLGNDYARVRKVGETRGMLKGAPFAFLWHGVEEIGTTRRSLAELLCELSEALVMEVCP